MRFHSTNNPDLKTNFRTALLSGIAPDGGLYVPDEIPDLSDFIASDAALECTFPELAFEIAQRFIEDEIPKSDLQAICEEAFNFSVPLVEVEQNHSVLELFHGPTAAFKDFAARFMARCVSNFLVQNHEEKMILVATSGDTGGAVGSGFLGVPNVRVVILYPEGGVSTVQEAQLTTMGQNIQALEVAGSFDDCQQLVKQAFLDGDISADLKLMSANSINIGRVIPQSFYHAWSSLQVKKNHPESNLVITVPSGNFGNITGGLWAKKMGFPIHKLIASNNANHPFCDYLSTGEFKPAPSVATLSNAMDIGHPNNFYRIEHLYGGDLERMKEDLWGTWYTDEQTEAKIQAVDKEWGYLACPHTAVGLLGTADYKTQFGSDNDYYVTASTAHPAKFPETMEPILGRKIEIPPLLSDVLEKEKQAVKVAPDLNDVISILKS